MTDHRAIMAAHNNADWYRMMFDIHDLPYRVSPIAFLGAASPPSFHSWMTTLDPNAQAELLLLVKQNAERPQFGVKDSYHCLDLLKQGFIELFTASWIFAESIQSVDTTGWVKISSQDELSDWEYAWSQGGALSGQRHFPAAILNRGDVAIWGRRASNGYDAGVIANVSSNCVGLSNYFGQDAYPAAARLCSELSNAALPVVGYERGDDLSAALDVGFLPTGELCIWDRR